MSINSIKLFLLYKKKKKKIEIRKRNSEQFWVCFKWKSEKKKSFVLIN